jgi:hypothetical protein
LNNNLCFLIRHSGLRASPTLDISLQSLQDWKQRIVQYQRQVVQEPNPVQSGFFDLPDPDTVAGKIDPFSLNRQNIEFWRWPVHETGLAALYFVIDYEQRLLLYVGETCKSSQRWKGVHDCKRYVRNYLGAHRMHGLSAQVGIGFWTHAPAETRPRQRMELRLIEQWRSPFNKENWKYWGTPFTWGKP